MRLFLVYRMILDPALIAAATASALAQGIGPTVAKCHELAAPTQTIVACSAVIAGGKVDPTGRATAFRNRGNAHGDEGRYDLALADFEQALAIDAGYVDVYISRGTTFATIGRYDLALQDFDRALALDAVNARALANRCFARALLGHFEQGLADCEESLRLEPGNPAGLASRGFLHLKSKRFEQAIADYTAELQVRPEDPYALFGRGMARYMTGDLRSGDDDVVQAEDLRPGVAEQMARYGIEVRKLR